MRRILRPASLAITILFALPTCTALAGSNEVSVQPSLAAPGQTVTLHWLFTGNKVLLSGGRFGKGVVVTGRMYASDTPQEATQYKFDVWYSAPAIDKTTHQAVSRPEHVTYTAMAQVLVTSAPMSVYRDPYGWQVAYLSGWKFDSVPMPDPNNNRLIYFQQEDDSIERLAVSVVPGERMTCQDLMSRVQKSLAASYDDPIVLSDKVVTVGGAPAVESEFTGLDHSHPDVRSQSVVLTFVKEGRGFVVSARTGAGDFAAKRPLLEKMVQSVIVSEAKSSSRAQ